MAHDSAHANCDAYECRCPEGPRESTTDVGRCGRCGGDLPVNPQPARPMTEAGQQHVEAVMDMHARLNPTADETVQWATREVVTAAVLAIEAEAASKAVGKVRIYGPTAGPR